MDEAGYLAHLRDLNRRIWPAGVPREAHYPLGEVPLADYLHHWAQVQGDKPAFIFYGATLTFRDLDAQSDRFAALLAAEGIKKGDRVAVFLPNCPQFIIAFFGILKCGAVHVPVNPLFREHELLYELDDTQAEVIVALDQLLPLVRAVKARSRLRMVFVTSFADVVPAEPSLPLPPALREPKVAGDDAVDFLPALAQIREPRPKVAIDIDDIAALNYTGGTTGMPKGCVHTHRDMIYTAATACTIALDSQPDDIGLCFYPIFWIAGEDLGLIFPIFSGATYVLLARWDPIAFMAAVETYKVNLTSMLVDNAAEVMEHPDLGRYDLTSLRKVRVSSFVKKLNPAYRRRWREITGATMMEAAWGMTETHTCDTFTVGMQEGDMDLLSQPIFVGLPMPGTEFKICDFETGALKPLDEEGEIRVRSPSLLKAYWNKPEASREALRDGWLHTGDIGLIDHDGYLHFLGRRKEMLKVKGMSVFPAEIEALLGQHPSVIGSGVIGRPDAERGQVPVAFVRIAQEKPIDAQKLAAWCRQNMATYKVPEIRIVEDLPMTATGKVKKEELAKLL